LIITVRLLKQKGTVFKMHAEAHVEDNLVAEAELMATLGTSKKESESAD
jgi:hypothetical protein